MFYHYILQKQSSNDSSYKGSNGNYGGLNNGDDHGDNDDSDDDDSDEDDDDEHNNEQASLTYLERLEIQALEKLLTWIGGLKSNPTSNKIFLEESFPQSVFSQQVSLHLIIFY